MPTVKQQLRAVPQLLRLKPVMSWGLSALLLGAAVSYSRVGMDIDVFHGILAVFTVLLAQGVVSHGLNDAYDWITGTDMMSIGKGTGGSRVIPEGKMTVKGTIAVAVAGMVCLGSIGIYFASIYGVPMVVLFAIAIWSSVSYSAPPLKLGYRPFNELVVVLPALVGVVVGTELVLTGDWTVIGVGVGFMHAMFCISWFIVSRIPDYEPDKSVGKVTSVVFVGRRAAPMLAVLYLVAGFAAMVILASEVSFIFGAALLPWAYMVTNIQSLNPYDEEMASVVRLENMHATSANAVLISTLMVAVGV